jgi:hypothetical protein
MIMGLFYENTKLELDKTKRELNKCQVEAGYVPGGDIEKDSLRLELFNSQNINGRYELSLEYLKEVNPKAAKQFENYLSNETE